MSRRVQSIDCGCDGRPRQKRLAGLARRLDSRWSRPFAADIWGCLAADPPGISDSQASSCHPRATGSPPLASGLRSCLLSRHGFVLGSDPGVTAEVGPGSKEVVVGKWRIRVVVPHLCRLDHCLLPSGNAAFGVDPASHRGSGLSAVVVR